MRAVPDEPLVPWQPPAYQVDGSGKVAGARPGEPNNWSRFGDDDQRGLANLFTPERVADAARLVRTGKRFALGLPIGPPSPGVRPPPLHLFRHSTGDTVLGDTGMFAGQQISDDYLIMALQATTQLDGLCHVAVDDSMYNGYWAGLVTGGHGARRLGVHHLAEGIVARAVVLDVARHVGVDRLEGGFGIDPELLDDVAGAAGVEIGAGDVLLVRTGWLEWWYAATDATGNRGLPVRRSDRGDDPVAGRTRRRDGGVRHRGRGGDPVAGRPAAAVPRGRLA